jgi:hypothetical protein
MRMRFQEVANPQGLVGREVVGDYVDLRAARLVDDDVGEERDELRGSMAGRSLAEHLNGFGVELGVQRQRAVSEVPKAVALGTARRDWQNRILAVERLDGCLLIDAKHPRMCRRSIRSASVSTIVASMFTIILSFQLLQCTSDFFDRPRNLII